MKKSLLFFILAICCHFTANTQNVEFSDDFESGTANWVLQGAWGRTNAQAHTGMWSLTDSPNGNYAASQNITATMATGVDLTGDLDATLSFWAIYDIENGNFDYCYVEASGDGGSTWVNLATFFGEDLLSPWTQYTYSLGGFVGNSDVKVRFRLLTDGGYEVDGIYIDDFEITSSDEDLSPPLILHDPPDFYYSTLGDQEFNPEVIDISGVDEARIFYSVDGGPFTVGSSLIIGNSYSFFIDAQSPGSQVDYYFEAVDASPNANVATSPTYSYIAGHHILYDNEQVDFVQSFGPDAMSGLMGCAVRFSLFGETDIVYALIRNYTDSNRPNSDFRFHIWANDNGLPGADLITPFMVTPEANLVVTSPMTRIDLSPYLSELSDLNGDVFMGYTVHSGETWLGQTTPAVGVRSYVFDGNTWGLNPNDDYHFRIVTSGFAPPDACMDAADLTGLTGQGLGNPQTSIPFNNSNATVDGTEPTEGFECFEEGTLENTLWYTFTGDGLVYEITTIDCGGTTGFYLEDTQIAVYQGTECGALTPVACNEDVDEDNGIFEALVQVETEVGVTYYMMIDGWEGETGEFCVQFDEVAAIDCDDIAVGAASGELYVCFGETTSLSIDAGTVIPGNGPILGFVWSVHGSDVSGSTDPFNDASWLGNFGQVFTVDDIYTPMLVNDGSQLDAGAYYFTPVVFGGGEGANIPWPEVDFSNGCVLAGNSVQVILLPQLDPLVNDIVTVDETLGMMDGEASVTTTGGTGSYTYMWSNGATTSTVTDLSEGTYMVTITDETGCEEVVETVVIDVFVNAEEAAFQNALSIQPNPTSGLASVSFNFNETVDLSISILNPIGKVVKRIQPGLVQSGHANLDLTQLPEGVYFVNITDGKYHALRRLVVTSN